MLPHPLYSPNLALPEFYLFRALKNAVRSVKFKTDEDVISAVRTWLHEDKEWYQQGTHALVSHWGKAVEVGGDFFEKLSFETNLLT
jgi:hypothetical protein